MTIKTSIAQYETMVKHIEILYYQKRETKAVLARVLEAILQNCFISLQIHSHVISFYGKVESSKKSRMADVKQYSIEKTQKYLISVKL